MKQIIYFALVLVALFVVVKLLPFMLNIALWFLLYLLIGYAIMWLMCPVARKDLSVPIDWPIVLFNSFKK